MKLTIPTSCNQSWAGMVSTDLKFGESSAARFCFSCQKSVHDFSSYSDEQLIDFFQKKNKNICGRIRTEQLNRALVFSKPVNTFSNKWFAGLIGLFTLVKTGNAQNISKKDESGKIISEKQVEEVLNVRSCRANYFTGKIIDSKTKKPIQFVTIKNLLDNSVTISDYAGKFRLPVESIFIDGEKIRPRYKLMILGAEEREFSIPENKMTDTIYLEQAEGVILDEVKVVSNYIPILEPDIRMGAMIHTIEGVTKPSFRSKARSFFFRIFHHKKYKEMMKKKEGE